MGNAISYKLERMIIFMAREKTDFRTTLEQLNKLFPDRELLTMAEVQSVTGYSSKDSVRKYFPPVCGGRFNKTTVARILAGGRGA